MKVFEPITIAGLTLPNRLLLAPVKTAFGDMEGKVTDRLIDYYQRRARGGVGTIIVEPLYVAHAGKEHPRQLGIDSDDKIEGLQKLVAAIHSAGAKAIAHLNHAGRAANPKATGCAPEAPSDMLCPSTGARAKALAETRIREIIEEFVSASRRVLESGFDGVEIQCGLGYLLAQFLSPLTNHRDDGYGGSTEKRERFVREVVGAMRESMGPDHPLIARISATEQVEGGLGLEDGQTFSERLADWGIAAVHVVTGSACDTPPWYFQHMSLPEGKNEEFAARIRAGLGIPVIVAGRLGDPERILSLLVEEQADMVALGRPLIADPDLPRKMREGNKDAIMRCGSCLQGCLANVKAGKGLACLVNPEVGHESEIEEPVQTPRNIVVIGGGPAGLTSAIVARRRGHRVTLLERGELGGQFALSCRAPGKAAMEKPLRSLVNLAQISGADIRTGVEATADEVMDLAPEAVIVATGAKPIIPEIPGLKEVVTGMDILRNGNEVGQRILVLGGGYVGIEVAEFLASKGKEVEVVEILDDVARDMEMITRKLTMMRLSKLPIKIRTETTLVRMDKGKAVVKDKTGERDLGFFDTVVVAVGTHSQDDLSKLLGERGLEVYLVGDARELGQVIGAVQSGWEIARRL